MSNSAAHENVLESIDVFGIRSDRLLELLMFKAEKDGGEIDELIPNYISELYEAMEKGDNSVC